MTSSIKVAIAFSLMLVAVSAQENTVDLSLEQRLGLQKKYARFLEDQLSVARAIQKLEASQRDLDAETKRLQSVCDSAGKEILRASDGDVNCVDKKKPSGAQ